MQGQEEEKYMNGSEKSTHAQMYRLLDKSVKTGGVPHTHTAGLEVDYRTPDEIFLSPQTDSGRGLTTGKTQNKHFHTCNIDSVM